jgi:signal transduction histidine kinase
MRWSIPKRSLGIYVVLLGCGAGVCAWQWGEHQRFKQTARQALINRGRDITSTLGIVVSSQRRFGNLVVKERIESALQGLIHEGELESIAIVGKTGETIASAGPPIELTPEITRSGGVYWHDQRLTLMNLMDLGTASSSAEDSSLPAALVVSNPRMTKAFRTTGNRPGAVRSEMRPGPGATESGSREAAPATPPPSLRFPYSRPAWMEKEEYDTLIKKQGVHSLLISLSTVEMRRAVHNDWLLRSLVSLLAGGGAIVSVFAWRNVSRNADLQIRLVKAGEMNSHLTQMNFAAAGLAHETRNPLNLIRGLAQMIAMQAHDAPKLKEHASSIIEEADRVTVQLNEFIDYSKPREAHLAPVDVPRLVADVARTLLPDIEDKQIHFDPPATPLTVEADEQLFRQALFNLLLNAVQAVAPGGRIEIQSSITGPGEAALEVRDNGPGVPESERSNIFKPYVTMRANGVGLGLAIVQQIVAAHRWEITCGANHPTGAVFRLTHLKLAPGAQ